MAKKVLLYSDQEDFLLCNIAPFLPFVPIADHSCSGLSSYERLEFHEVLPARNRQRRERKHPQPLPIKNGNIRRSRFTTPLASDPKKPASPQPMEAISRPAK